MKHLTRVLVLTAALGGLALGTAAAQTTVTNPATPPAATQPTAPTAPTPPAPPPPASRCPEFPPAPTLPPAVSNIRELNAGTEAFNNWRASMNPIEECRRAEAQELAAQVRALDAQRLARIAEFNAAMGTAQSLGSHWISVRDAYQAAGGGNQRERGSSRASGGR